MPLKPKIQKKKKNNTKTKISPKLNFTNIEISPNLKYHIH